MATGAGMLAHNRAFLDWVDGLFNRYPGLTTRELLLGWDAHRLCDAVPLSAPLHQRPAGLLRYPPIAAAPRGHPPEQAAVWAYPQPEWDDHQIAFSFARDAWSGYLSGHLDR